VQLNLQALTGLPGASHWKPSCIRSYERFLRPARAFAKVTLNYFCRLSALRLVGESLQIGKNVISGERAIQSESGKTSLPQAPKVRLQTQNSPLFLHKSLYNRIAFAGPR